MSSVIRPNFVLLLAALPLTAQATNGYFMHGYSIQSQGMAGVSYAQALDSIQAASNPAALTALGSRVDAGLNLFRPDRSAEITQGGSAFSFDGNGDEQFWIPQVGFANQYSERLAYGVAVYANGGMNTSYSINPFGAAGEAGVDLSQLFVTASLAIKANEQHSLGLGLTHVYQRFAATGIQGFNPASTTLSNNGHDTSTGWGLRLGWQGQVSDNLTLGASWASRIHTDRFARYSGLFAEQGGFDVPESYGVGFSVKLNPQWTVAGDWERINYSEVRSVGNPLTLPPNLGSASGAGFGWQDIEVYKLGVSFAINPQLTLRAGVSHSDQPIPADQTFFNILAPGVIEDHVSLGGTWQLSPAHSVSVSYTRALNNKVKGSGSIPGPFGGGEADLEMNQDLLGIAWHYQF